MLLFYRQLPISTNYKTPSLSGWLYLPALGLCLGKPKRPSRNQSRDQESPELTFSSMSPETEGEPTEYLSGEDDDDGLQEAMEALRQACVRTGANPNDLHEPSDNEEPRGVGASDSETEDAFEIYRRIKDRFKVSNEECEILSRIPLCIMPPDDSDDEDDDFDILRAIQKRFSAYAVTDKLQKDKEDCVVHAQQLEVSSLGVEGTTCDNVRNGFEESCVTSGLSSDSCEIQLSDIDRSCSSKPSTSEPQDAGFLDPANDFVVAIRRNRAYQKFLRSKLGQIEAKLQENKMLKERVKLLRDFQISCRKMTGRGLSQRKDPRVQLVSSFGFRSCKGEKGAPPENPDVANYRSALTRFPHELHRGKWSKEDREKLLKGVHQQIQELELCDSMDRSHERSHGGETDLEGILSSIKNLEITPQSIRARISQIDWDQLASIYVAGRSGAECATQWLNHEDPLINRSRWTAEEDKQLLHIIQKEGITDFCNVAACLGTNRAPYQCLLRYQRSLNVDMLNRNWTKEEDDQLCDAVKTYGESNWQSVASTLEKRSGAQCSERWKKSLVPTTKGKWTLEESKRLKVAVVFFGPKCWNKIAQFVPGRGQAQCRERWVNVLNPSLSSKKWSEREDSLLDEAVEEHGYHWSRVAACIPPRTDNECWRRWKALHPGEAAKLAAARKEMKKLIPSNFVDRRSERPALDPVDIIELPLLNSVSEKSTAKKRRQTRKPSCTSRTSQLAVSGSNQQNITDDVLGVSRGDAGEDKQVADGNEVEAFGEHVCIKKKTKKLGTAKSISRLTKRGALMSSPEVCARVNSDQAEHDAARRKRRRSLDRNGSDLKRLEDPILLTSMSMFSTNDNGNDCFVVERDTTSKKKRMCSSGKRLRKSVVAATQSDASADLGIPDGNEAEASSENVIIKKTKKPDSPKNVSQLTKEGALMFSSEVRVKTDCGRTEHDDSRRKGKRHLCRNSSNSKPIEDGISPTSMSVFYTNGNENDWLIGGNVVDSKMSQRKASKNRQNKPYDLASDTSSMNSWQSGTTVDADMMHDLGVSGKANPEVGSSDESNMVLAHLFPNQSEKMKRRSSSNESCAMTDEGNLKLVHRVSSKLDRKNQNLAQTDRRNLNSSAKSNREKYQGMGNGENTKVASFQDKKSNKVGQMVDNEDRSAVDEDNVILACFLQKLSTQRRCGHLRDAHSSPLICYKRKKRRPCISCWTAETGSGCVNPESGS